MSLNGVAKINISPHLSMWTHKREHALMPHAINIFLFSKLLLVNVLHGQDRDKARTQNFSTGRTGRVVTMQRPRDKQIHQRRF
jgi:hypothetical protein